MFGVAGFGAYNIYTALDGGGSGGSGGTHAGATSAPPKPLTARQVADTASDFLSAWTQGDIPAAARLTDARDQATASLTGLRTDGHVTAVEAIASTRSAAQIASNTVPFTVDATVSYQGLTDHWTYGSSLTVSHGPGGKPAVHWAPAVLHPDLKAGETVVTGPAKAPDLEVRDRDGVVMTADKYPSLARIFDDFRKRYGAKLHGGTPGIETYIEDPATGTQGLTLDVLRKGKGARLDTTLDAHLQAAAEKAVAGKDKAGVTAVDADTGGILAVAYSPATGQDWALLDKAAPGSTFKVVTSAALLERNMTPTSAAPCRNGANYLTGRAYHNDGGMNNPGADLDWDFRNSCNTGFITQAGRLGPSGLLDTAGQFGLTQGWNVGTPANDPHVPGGTDDELTSEMIGQGQLEMTPLVMASVAATARTGDFHQPRIVDPALINGPIAKAPGISSAVSHELRRMMHDTIASGTASGVMSGFGSDSGAKTGSAEVDGAANPNGWFCAYSGHVAAAAVVHGGGHGNASAGPIVAAVLRAS
jgi:hypothetical protein